MRSIRLRSTSSAPSAASTRRPALALMIGASALALLAGCGSSSKTTSSSASAPASGGAYGAAPAQSAAATTTAAPSAGGVHVGTTHGPLGIFLVAGPKQQTVYLFEADKGTHSACSGECASAWPPVTTTGAPVAFGEAVAADLGTVTRPDGLKQVTYHGHPLYFFVQDKATGQASGQGSKAFGASWYVLAPSGKKIDKS
jgi:predicted lipoprotein with Yx(FWY)xxD motif